MNPDRHVARKAAKLDDQLEGIAASFEAEVHVFATWNHPAPHWTEITGVDGAPAYRGRCRKKVYRTFAHAATDARSIRFHDGERDAARAYWCRRCRGFHVGRPGGSRHERVALIRPETDLRAA